MNNNDKKSSSLKDKNTQPLDKTESGSKEVNPHRLRAVLAKIPGLVYGGVNWCRECVALALIQIIVNFKVRRIIFNSSSFYFS